MKRFKSDIPPNVVEQVTHEFRRDGGAIYHRLADCVLNGEVVGQRMYGEEGQLVRETPLRNGLKHGRVYEWEDDGTLSLIEPYVNGKIHGTAKQYGRDGSVIGTYSLRHGTGYDIWRVEDEDGAIYIHEIHPLKDGLPHGYEWWLESKPHIVYEERHWHEGEYHGIEREWNTAHKLRRGFPRYWIKGERVDKRKYLRAAKEDPSLPPFRLKDNSPRRKFPPEIEQLFGLRAKQLRQHIG
jgi:antitoxin component YwqK of YwqJK toxin-antitoxin module